MYCIPLPTNIGYIRVKENLKHICVTLHPNKTYIDIKKDSLWRHSKREKSK